MEKCRNDVILINTSRGAIWDEQIVATRLVEGKIKGVATDVLSSEYTDDFNPLISLLNQNFNIIITPHIAGATYESMHMTELFIAQKIINLL